MISFMDLFDKIILNFVVSLKFLDELRYSDF